MNGRIVKPCHLRSRPYPPVAERYWSMDWGLVLLISTFYLLVFLHFSLFSAFHLRLPIPRLFPGLLAFISNFESLPSDGRPHSFEPYLSFIVNFSPCPLDACTFLYRPEAHISYLPFSSCILFSYLFGYPLFNYSSPRFIAFLRLLLRFSLSQTHVCYSQPFHLDTI